MALIPFAEWLPDMPALGGAAREALNVVPAAASYRPLNSLTSISNALTARAQGAAWFRGTGGAVKMFAGDATKLYLLSGATWGDVSRLVGGAYAPGTEGTWRFAQFGSLAFAVNGLDDLQSFDLAAGTNWEDSAGSPPSGASFIATVGNFLVLGKIGSNPQRIQWSPYNNATGTWGSIAATQADLQDLPDGGDVTGLVGGEYGVVLQETAVRRMTYEGPPVVHRIDVIAQDIGCSVPNSVAGFLNRAFFLHKSGFYMVVGGQQVLPIGRDKVDRTFWGEFDESKAHLCSAAIDPVRSLYIFAYCANSSSIPNRLLIYNWATERWSHAAIECEIVFGGVSQQSYTLEQLDSFGTLETLPYSLDSSYWSGAVSLLLFAFDSTHKSGSFSGGTLAATVETGEFNADGNGKRSIIRGCRPLIDGGSPQIQIGARETQQASVGYTTAVGLTPAGMAPVYTSGRYFRVRASQPAGAVWNNMMGVDDLDFRPAGGQ